MKLKTKNVNGIIIFEFFDENIQELRENLLQIFEMTAKKTNKIILNLNYVQNINSYLIGIISSTKRLLDTLKGDLVIVCNQEKILNIFKIVRLDKILKIFKNEKEAIDYFLINFGDKLNE